MERLVSKRSDQFTPLEKMAPLSFHAKMEPIQIAPKPTTPDVLPASGPAQPIQYVQPRQKEYATTHEKQYAGPRVMERAGNTSYRVVPASAASVNAATEVVEVPASKLVEVAGTNTSQVQSTPITAYRGSAKGY